MFYVIDLSSPRKAILNKYDNIMLELKLNPLKTNKKTLIISSVVIISLIAASSTVYAVNNLSTEEYKYLMDHYINNLHYPKDVVTDILNKCNEDEIKNLYASAKVHNEGIQNFDRFLFINRKIIRFLGKPLHLIFKGIDYLIFE